MRKVMLGSLLVISLLAVGCAPTSPQGGFYSNATIPTGGSLGVTGNATGSKQGKACKKTILGMPEGGFLTFGDASIQAAAKDGGISKVSSVSAERMNILFFYSKRCTVVSGD